MSEAHQPQILVQTVWETWQNAERALKETELAAGNLCVPAVNELRYAGTHLLRGIVSKNDELNVAQDEFWKAHRHCRRAIYDCYEYGCLHLIKAFQNFEIRWNGWVHLIPDVIKDYGELTTKVNDAHSRLSAVDRSENGDRDKYADEAKDLMGALSDVHRVLQCNEPLLAAKAENEKKQTRKHALWAIWGIALTVILSVAGIIISIILSK